jgi:hypothetical protein
LVVLEYLSRKISRTEYFVQLGAEYRRRKLISRVKSAIPLGRKIGFFQLRTGYERD